MSDEFRIVDVWLGRFPNKKCFTAYLKETYSDSNDDNTPLSQFASDQGQTFYDHDFVESSFHRLTTDCSRLLDGHSIAQSHLAEAIAQFKSSGFQAVNAVIVVFNQEIQRPVSVAKADCTLTYLGRFECTPEKSVALGDSGPPAIVYLIIGENRPMSFQGESVSSIPIDSRGLVIGAASTDDGTPCLDLSGIVDNVAPVQVKIYQDQFDQWVIEDVGSNGLTRVDGEVLEGRNFPWHGKRLLVGDLEFLWSIRPSIAS